MWLWTKKPSFFFYTKSPGAYTGFSYKFLGKTLSLGKKWFWDRFDRDFRAFMLFMESNTLPWHLLSKP